ncbi:hypothetical protein [Streptomyces sp. NPDC056549]
MATWAENLAHSSPQSPAQRSGRPTGPRHGRSFGSGTGAAGEGAEGRA